MFNSVCSITSVNFWRCQPLAQIKRQFLEETTDGDLIAQEKITSYIKYRKKAAKTYSSSIKLSVENLLSAKAFQFFTFLFVIKNKISIYCNRFSTRKPLLEVFLDNEISFIRKYIHIYLYPFYSNLFKYMFVVYSVLPWCYNTYVTWNILIIFIMIMVFPFHSHLKSK